MAPSRSIKLFGTEEPVGELIPLRAGPLQASLDAGNLRYITVGGREALRAVAFLVRDRNWGTYNPAIADLAVDQGADSFTVTYEAVCSDADQSFGYRARIEGRADGSLSFEADGEAARRLRHQPHRLRGAAPARRRGRPSRHRRAHRRRRRREQLPRADRPGVPVP